MSESGAVPEESAEALRGRLAEAERRLAEVEAAAAARLVRAELKAEAVRAGMVDLDGLKLMDLARVRVGEDGQVEGAAVLMQELRRAKPWLFGQPSSSSASVPPPAQPPRQKLATEMSEEEWRAARADLLRRR